MWGYYSRSDWFKDLMGFREGEYFEAQSNMEVIEQDGRPMLRSKVNEQAYGCGILELGTSLASLSSFLFTLLR